MMDPVDYLVVGGGLAGLVVATRLAEDPDVLVGVLETGQNMSQDTDIQTPGLYSKGMRNPETDWGFFTTPQDALNARRIYLPRGKGLGGSTLLNLMQLGRASAVEYDAFEQLGSPGWNWSEFLKYFKKSETFTASPDTAAYFGMTSTTGDAHGTSGPLPKILPPFTTPLHHRVLEAFMSVGIPLNSEPNSGYNAGCYTGTVAVHPVENKRASSASAYYEPHKSRPNLIVLTGAYATRVVFENGDNTGDVIATSVEYQKDGTTYLATARKEIILCTGTFKTPQLLELSGIGDKKLLDSFGIPVVVELPGVGNNLQDHLWCPFTCELTPEWESNDVLRNPVRALEEAAEYMINRTGILSAPPMSAFAFLPLSSVSHDRKILDEVPAYGINDEAQPLPGVYQTWQLQKEWLGSDQVPFVELANVSSYVPNTKAKPLEGRNYLSFLIGLLHPFSRGSVHISSDNPLGPPEINPQFMKDAFDMELLISSIKLIRKVVASESIKPAVAREVAPGPEVQFDDEIAEYARANLQTIYHPLGTASMLPREAGGVVDEGLKVYGTRNLRVVDASVIPIQLSAHIQHTVYAIAEKAADIIKMVRSND